MKTSLSQISGLAVSSTFKFIKLICKGLLNLSKKRLGEMFQIDKKGKYKIFRETQHKKSTPNPVVLIVGFRLS